MRILQGIAVSPGVAIGEAVVIDDKGYRIPRRFIARGAVESEMQRLEGAFAAVGKQIEQSRDEIAGELGQQYGAIFSAHLQMLQDAKLRTEIDHLVKQRHYSAEYAITRALGKYSKFFENLPTAYLRERANDVHDIERRLMGELIGNRREALEEIKSPVVVLANNLTPSETANLNREMVLGFVTEVGGPGGHTAIVAEALEIPAVVGVGDFLNEVSGGDLVIVDGDQGRVIFQPDDETIARYEQEVEEHRSLAARLDLLRDLPSELLSGEQIHLYANIEFPHEVDACLQRGAEGIGLYRTEFLYLGQEQEPTEEDHYQVYAKVVQDMGGAPVVIRTLDLGADKIARAPNESRVAEANPFLGLRSIRLSLRNISLFRTQLRAVLRASMIGEIHVMFPLVSTLHELRQAKMLLTDIMEDLDEEGIPYDRNLKIGMMVEVPSSVIMLDHFAKEVDFISIGTNDLVQYTLAVDRSNKEVAALYNNCDPAVLRLIEMTVRLAKEADIKTTLCGQMGGNPIYAMLLIGLGLRSLSITPSAIPEIKKVCRSVSLAQCEEVARRVREMENAREIKRYLREEVRRAVPELMM
ncbi:phosphoenolpyruvate--protein phosphotransferase [Blastopirellula marina]|uniref:Phosphoenolpyruvate-protein phosphotransferase n=1 Tax=Blastopirellula marina DSM 3645 TaxID=314230 RepID=A3ZLB0_9BACT|nr:phosphoenolpyruvate--protein phosphotransferase [Blastopirellula marina]EAQ82543.1 phosphoenolpyruvate-protein phosphotransferase [Blastopirellula marina DSM 3645]